MLKRAGSPLPIGTGTVKEVGSPVPIASYVGSISSCASVLRDAGGSVFLSFFSVFFHFSFMMSGWSVRLRVSGQWVGVRGRREVGAGVGAQDGGRGIDVGVDFDDGYDDGSRLCGGDGHAGEGRGMRLQSR